MLLVTSAGRAFKVDVLPLPVLPEQAGTVSLRGGMSAAELVPLEPGRPWSVSRRSAGRPRGRRAWRWAPGRAW
ncbi:hypothetical protein GCM10027614_72980 [Micromonospora vulcania]